jgi:hypothetical protein
MNALIAIILVLVILWLVGFFAFLFDALIHILLMIAVIWFSFGCSLAKAQIKFYFKET